MPQELSCSRVPFGTRVEGVAKDRGEGFSENAGEREAVFTLMELVWSSSRINETKT